jgi:uncharacterized protein YbbK (DUF523 family)
MKKIPLGVSSCLLGERVRYDGGHKLDPDIEKNLGEIFEFRAFCPEVAIGLGVPRPPMRLIIEDNTRGMRCVVSEDTRQDYTRALRQCANEQLGWQQKVYGYILKSGSPSCGVKDVKVYTQDQEYDNGVGIYAAATQGNFPDLPMEDEKRLKDSVIRENFTRRVISYWRSRQGQ